MGELRDILKSLRIPSLSLIGLLLYFGVDLIKNSAGMISLDSMAGFVLLAAAFVFASFTFADYRYKEYTDNVIKQQGQAIDILSRALSATSDTHTVIERTTRSSFDKGIIGGSKIGKPKRGQYEIEKTSPETLDN